MTTFVLNKYEPKKEEKTTDQNTENETTEVETEKEEAYIMATGTISEIVYKALHKTFANVTELEENDNSKTSNYKAVSTEDINNNPIETFNSIKENDVVLIHTNKAFSTSKEEWFLSNIGNKTKNVFYTVESFVKYLESNIKS
ncbi:MAG: hypothetical protein ACD_33C00045G0019 [uncultured bacterium]|nr:MAG: hypothetical protein ACD_33C00045G0019 [uncultured bacterium]